MDQGCDDSKDAVLPGVSPGEATVEAPLLPAISPEEAIALKDKNVTASWQVIYNALVGYIRTNKKDYPIHLHYDLDSDDDSIDLYNPEQRDSLIKAIRHLNDTFPESKTKYVLLDKRNSNLQLDIRDRVWKARRSGEDADIVDIEFRPLKTSRPVENTYRYRKQEADAECFLM